MFLSLFVFLLHHPAENHRHPGARRRCQNGRERDGSGIHAAILAAVGDHGDRNQLKGENIHENTSARDFHILCGGVVK